MLLLSGNRDSATMLFSFLHVSCRKLNIMPSILYVDFTCSYWWNSYTLVITSGLLPSKPLWRRTWRSMIQDILLSLSNHTSPNFCAVTEWNCNPMGCCRMEHRHYKMVRKYLLAAVVCLPVKELAYHCNIVISGILGWSEPCSVTSFHFRLYYPIDWHLIKKRSFYYPSLCFFVPIMTW